MAMYTFYKYLNRKHAENLVHNGQILIRPLNEFKDQEKFGDKIGDLSEGVVKFFPRGRAFDTSDPNHNKSLASLISGNIEAGHIRIEAENYIQIHTNNCFIYSVSQLKDPELMKEFGYDTCVEIKDFAGFYKTITDCIIKNGYKVIQTEVNECWYQAKDVSLEDELPYTPAFIKDVKFENQKEVRAAWTITDIEEKPLILSYPEIGGFCSIVKV